MNGLNELFHNMVIWSALFSWAVAQAIKFVTTWIRTGHFDFGAFVSTGGMPSAHSSMACGLAMSMGLNTGFDSPVFAVTLAFAGVVMFDAQGVRRAADHQAILLNQIVEELFKDHHLSQQKLAEFIGHTRKEVFVGMALGIMIACIFHYG